MSGNSGPDVDITNKALSRIFTVEFLVTVMAVAFGCGVTWMGITSKVSANSMADITILTRQTGFISSLRTMEISQTVIKTEIGGVKDNQAKQQRDIDYLRSQSDEIKTLLIQMKRNNT